MAFGPRATAEAFSDKVLSNQEAEDYITPMSTTMESVATADYGISRVDQDAFAARSCQKAAAAQAGKFVPPRHPQGCTGLNIAKQAGKTVFVTSMCIGSGTGMAAVFVSTQYTRPSEAGYRFSTHCAIYTQRCLYILGVRVRGSGSREDIFSPSSFPPHGAQQIDVSGETATPEYAWTCSMNHARGPCSSPCPEWRGSSRLPANMDMGPLVLVYLVGVCTFRPSRVMTPRIILNRV